MFLADLHVHSQFSDGRLSIAELVDFYGQRGFGCIAITDHLCETGTVLGAAARFMNLTLTRAHFNEYMRVIHEEAARAWKRYGMVVLPGFEISKNTLSNNRSAHILGLGLADFVSPNLGVQEIARAIRLAGGLSVAAHPVPTGKAEIQTLHLWSRREELAHEFDAWEVASGRDIFEPVLKSGLPMIATSDFHVPKNINGWKTEFDCKRSPKLLLEAIRQQDLSFKFYEAEIHEMHTTLDAKSFLVREGVSFSSAFR